MTGNALLLYKLTCPPDMKEEDFQTFMNDEIFPAVSQESTRVGQVSALSLWRLGSSKHFVWAVEYSGLGEGAVSATKTGLEKLKLSGVKVTSDIYDRAS
jgi:hypothetical protein